VNGQLPLGKRHVLVGTWFDSRHSYRTFAERVMKAAMPTGVERWTATDSFATSVDVRHILKASH
jgi:hypothetical protein